MKVTVLVGGVGGARFLQGVKAALGLPATGPAPEGHPHEIDAIVNVGDDIWLHGLRVCPDLDTCMYTLGGGIDTEKGWGRADETWSIAGELAAYEADPTWFGLGDRDVATHLVRTRMLRAGYPLSQITEALCHRWQPGVRLIPASDDRVETHVVIDNPEATDAEDSAPQVAIHFQEWWIKHRAAPKAYRFASVGADQAAIAPDARAAIAGADVVLVAPSNPVVSIGTIVSVPGVPQALASTPAPIVGLSPIVGGRPVRGMADACLSAIGVETSAEGVGRHYGGRGEGGLLDGYLVHTGDSATVPGATVREVPLLMTDVEATAAMARAAFEVAGRDV
ncbi:MULTISPECIES: 2-phospho-L-lactate transferase [Pseudonocardia]|uniref:2-phospho-L-lactate transferase n=2 Tax=Pseudonocardia TaxID=1847 RepID=A0A1Y2MQT6_PSEAH|nr:MULTISPECIES: 2-phospho-L-lactate transferase [Pseudonocardia]OSY37570.1 2-phospho-L-lactate transferase [Pseudonocardia autotrophica]TDN73692.1 LPPG:FO 2-phospho-L-lactate transferase [Pseudonocardia autotrophica]BBG04436.1 2-phospho-L-lactate transferase [Pseudonocardia autotrophica]GEC27318.1 2-phospho-L-lactate transferase [Pseudonocardia saturnea]